MAHPGQHEQLARINRAIGQQPEQQALYLQRGMIYSSGGQFAEAREDYARAEQLGPPVLVAYELGVLYYRMGDFARATNYLDQYLAQFPSSAPAYEYRARAAREAGDYDAAMADLEMYFQLHSSPHPGNYIWAAKMLGEMDKTEKALTLLDQGLDKLGLIPQLQRQAIELELQRGQPAVAITRLETLRVPLKESPGWKLEMVALLMRAGHRQEAAILLLEAEAALNELRPTPARLALQRQARELQKRLDAERADEVRNTGGACPTQQYRRTPSDICHPAAEKTFFAPDQDYGHSPTKDTTYSG